MQIYNSVRYPCYKIAEVACFTVLYAQLSNKATKSRHKLCKLAMYLINIIIINVLNPSNYFVARVSGFLGLGLIHHQTSEKQITYIYNVYIFIYI